MTFQSTPPRRGDGNDKHRMRGYQVSIHAPAKGRLARIHARRQSLHVSIHAPAKGRRGVQITFHRLPLFQSTPPRRGDSRDANASPVLKMFQSTPPRRGDDIVAEYWPYSIPFQSTPPRRGDARINAARTRVTRFNPRPREGATTPVGCAKRVAHVSIHAPAKGRRDCRVDSVSYTVVSIHAPAKGRQMGGLM